MAGDARREGARSPQRFACLFIGDGISPPHWWAKGKGAEMELGAEPRAAGPVQGEDQRHQRPVQPARATAATPAAPATSCPGVALQRGRTIQGGVSMDQMLAKHFEDETCLPSLVLGCEQPVSGFHESQYSMVYASHISWQNPDSPIPIELYPVAGVRQPVRRQGRQAAREHPRRGAASRPTTCGGR